jgi:trans-aconitate 2-methyltransferase
MSWSANQYSKFESERNRPISDLLANVRATNVRTAVDLGCGPGNSTELLLARFPGAVVTGVDNSEPMVEAARRRSPDVRFEIDDIGTWLAPGPFDIIFANASLQWVPDHETLLPSLLGKLSSGGSLAVQIPDNYDEPAHELMRELAASGRWARLQTATARPARHTAEWYFRALRASTVMLDIWRTTYYHPLPGGAAAIVEWFKGTGLRPFIDALRDGERQEFLAEYEAAIAKAYPVLPDGTVLLPFPRLFFVAMR